MKVTNKSIITIIFVLLVMQGAFGADLSYVSLGASNMFIERDEIYEYEGRGGSISFGDNLYLGSTFFTNSEKRIAFTEKKGLGYTYKSAINIDYVLSMGAVNVPFFRLLAGFNGYFLNGRHEKDTVIASALVGLELAANHGSLNQALSFLVAGFIGNDKFKLGTPSYDLFLNVLWSHSYVHKGRKTAFANYGLRIYY